MPVAGLKAAKDAILDHFTTEWNAQANPPELHYMDVEKEQPDGATEWARVQIQHNTNPQVTLGGVGNRRFRAGGIVTVNIFTPFGDGNSRSDELAQVAIDAFQGRDTGLDAIEFRNARSQEVGRDGPWFMVNVLAEFEYDRIR